MSTHTDTPPDLNERLVVSIDRAADLLDLGRSSIYELLRAGRLKSVHIGRSRRITTESLKQLVAEADRSAG